jgi:hypothetical protein
LRATCSLWGNTGQIMPVQANVRYPASLAAACDGAYAVINLTGVLYSAGAQSFDAVHAFGAEACAKAARRRQGPGLHPDVGDRCRREFDRRICALEGRGREAGARRVSRCHHHPPVDRVRAGG